ncbi:MULTISPECIES: ABC transporter permease [Bacteroides]|uniref:ABC transporter permease n=1 Tax=Bacteroides TaxID=816 RepID=UPI002109602D|nr:ABC transporter permease [Bacteroides nordii]MCQ4916116.1 ABC transporter permease [Bacteroides nordii]
MIKFLIEKEFKQLFRNSFLPRLILVFPCMIMILMPWAMNLEIRNVSLNIVDNDHSVTSRRLVDKISASTYFRLTALPDSYDEALKNVEAGDADIILEIPRDFEKDCTVGRSPHVLIAANAVNGTKGGLGGSYLSIIIQSYASEVVALPVRGDTPGDVSGMANSQLSTPGSQPSTNYTTLNLFNPNLNYKLFMIPALMVMLLTLICGFLPALNIVSEKEVGTIEQINVTPVGKFTFILAKLFPYWLIGFVVLTICFILAWLLYGILPVGHFLVIYFFAILFVLSMSGLGLVISNHSATMQQAMFVMWFCMLILILMSGLFTPISSMPEWAQAITIFNPLKYLMQVMRMVYLKGSGFTDMLPQLGALLAFVLFFNVWAVRSYRKRV